MKGAVFLAVLSLGACQQTAEIPLRPETGGSLTFGWSGAFGGGGLLTTIYENDQMYRRYPGSVSRDGRTEWTQLPAGSFNQIASLAEAQLAVLATLDTSGECMDAGIEQLILIAADGTKNSYANSCPEDAAQTAFGLLDTGIQEIEGADR
ncbi:hypothetical protein SAMN04488515_1238 [Cognatiyoonia koreensis]|uniref:Lipoprotein n=1 Tax=Cognatiyoonia koreensis TaxID=364200 RepID=A0A1I0PJB3_9RHOB|nr:hypothetical protein [Cognatiyoonia koreensis]SEW13887.1 hypothetical protein SAMN04488515_1238 [Cognatiyoonia koreensis]